MFIFAINLWHRKFVIAYVAAVFFKRINMVFTRQDKILIKSLYLKGCTAKGLTDDEFPEKSSTKRGSSSSSSRNECYFLGGIVALLLQDHRTMSLKTVCSSQYMVTEYDQH